MNLRQWHTYIGLFIAPSLLFFAFTGTLQLFSLHEAHDGYHPPAILERLGRAHKDQVFALDSHDDDDAGPPHADHAGPAAEPAHHHHHDDAAPKFTVHQLCIYLLKWFFTFVALGLIVTTCLGLWLGLTNLRRRRTGWILLILGAVIPVLLLVF